MEKIRKIRGTQDILPDQSRHWQQVENAIRDSMSRFNYKEIRTPVFESTELFARGIGQLTDIVSKEMYSFEDRGKKQITLKPEMTAPVIRAYLENNLQAAAPLNKLYYIAPLFRQENPQAGRLRQFHQFGAEAIGSPAAEIDAELIMLAMNVYQELGISHLKLQINSVGDQVCRDPYKEELKNYIRPNLDQYCEDCQKRFDTNPMRILDCKQRTCKALNVNAPRLADHLCEDCEQHFETVKSLLKQSGVDFELNPFLVRGLDYYTRTVFEISSTNLGSQDAICGGGRYDLLTEQLGGKPTPASGFASGIERTIMVMAAQGLLDEASKRLDIYIAPLGPNASILAQDWLSKLRANGLTVDRDYLSRSLKAQMRDANRQQARLVFLLGDSEIESQSFSVKLMDESEQKDIRFADVNEFVKAYFSL